ncbi:MAG: Rrf2 family transcriptional regulator [Phycisphaerales bacterium]|nr:Rrf2 family transcriptional regulator [Phycisphaerales bacterium]
MHSLTAEYALRAMSCLAMHGSTLVPTTTLATQTKVPSNYLAKVLQQLAAAGLITGRRGVGGGYKLSRPNTEIKLLDVINAVDPVQRITSCPLGLTNHGSYLCPLHRKADQAAAAVIDIYKGVSLADLLMDPKSNKPLCDEETTAKLSIKGVLLDE